MFFVAIDGNEVGRKIDSYILTEQLDQLSKFSRNLTSMVLDIENNLRLLHGEIIFSGGDNVLARMPSNTGHEIIEIVSACQNQDVQFAIGFGDTPVNTYIALKCSKSYKTPFMSMIDGKLDRDYIP